MTLQASGAITLAEIRAEFGGSAPDALSEYYRGGGLVPDIAANAAIPTSGTIKLSDFYSSVNAVVNVPAFDIQDDGFTFTTNFAQASVVVMSTGGYIRLGAANSGFFSAGDWVTPTSLAPGLYQVRADLNSGSVSGTTGTWLNISDGDYGWIVEQNGAGFASGNITISIRYNGGAVLASASGSITAQVS